MIDMISLNINNTLMFSSHLLMLSDDDVAICWRMLLVWSPMYCTPCHWSSRRLSAGLDYHLPVMSTHMSTFLSLLDSQLWHSVTTSCQYFVCGFCEFAMSYIWSTSLLLLPLPLLPLLLLMLLLLTEVWNADTAALQGAPWHQQWLSWMIRQDLQRRTHFTKDVSSCW